MSLDDLRKKIYKPGVEFEKRPETHKSFRLDQQREQRVIDRWEEFEKKKEPITPQKKKKMIILSIIGIVIFISIAGWLIWRGLHSFNTSGVSLIINGPERIISGDEAIYTVDFKNNTRLALTNLKLTVYYPEGSAPANGNDLVQLFDLDDIGAGQESKMKIPVRIIGIKDNEKTIRVELNYQPSGISSRFISKADFSTEIISVPLALSFDLPKRLVDEQSFSFSLAYLNQAEIDFEDLIIEIEYPNGFEFDSAVPEPAQDNNFWQIGYLAADQHGEILINGSINGKEGDTRIFKAKLGFVKEDKFINYAEIVGSLDISLSPLFVSQTVNGSNNLIAYSGQRLDYQIYYKNTSDVGIKDVIINSKLEGKALDMSEIDLGIGSFNGQENIITWNAGNLAGLSYIASQEEGYISFSVKIKDNLPVNSLEDKNFKVFNTVDINASQKPLVLKEVEIASQSILKTKIASQLLLKTMAYHYDDTFSNSGPIPPKAGQTTQYTIKWQIINIGNDLENIKVSAVLPPHVKWKNKIYPKDNNLEYNTDTGLLVWQIDSLPASTGVLLPVKQIAFQVEITPGQAHLDSLVELIGQSTAVADDNFVQTELINVNGPIDTNLPDDSQIEWKDGIVIE